MPILLGHVVGFVLFALYVWRRLVARRRRKALVAAALAVINQYRGARPTPVQLQQLAHDYGIRMYTIHEQRAVVMNDLIDAVRDVN